MDVLLRGGGHIDLTTARKKPKEWIQDAVWANVLALAETDTFRYEGGGEHNTTIKSGFCKPCHSFVKKYTLQQWLQ